MMQSRPVYSEMEQCSIMLYKSWMIEIRIEGEDDALTTP